MAGWFWIAVNLPPDIVEKLVRLLWIYDGNSAPSVPEIRKKALEVLQLGCYQALSKAEKDKPDV